MRTFDEIMKYVEDEYPELSIMSRRRLSMRIACEEALDLAAENAKIIKTGNSGSYFDASVDKESILKLKEQLK